MYRHRPGERYCKHHTDSSCNTSGTNDLFRNGYGHRAELNTSRCNLRMDRCTIRCNRSVERERSFHRTNLVDYRHHFRNGNLHDHPNDRQLPRHSDHGNGECRSCSGGDGNATQPNDLFRYKYRHCAELYTNGCHFQLDDLTNRCYGGKQRQRNLDQPNADSHGYDCRKRNLYCRSDAWKLSGSTLKRSDHRQSDANGNSSTPNDLFRCVYQYCTDFHPCGRYI